MVIIWDYVEGKDLENRNKCVPVDYLWVIYITDDFFVLCFCIFEEIPIINIFCFY